MTTVGSATPAARLPAALRDPVIAATLLAAVLHLIWALALANDAGDLAAQYAWTEFTRQHPDAAYNLSWYGGIHTASYSVLSPYLMGLLGVRTTGVLAGTASAALAAVLLTRSGLRRPLAPALWTAFALWCDVASGRVTFAVGVAFGLAATVLAFTRGGPRLRGTALFALAALATMGSPVVGLFLEVAAAALLLTGRRRDCWPLAAAPVVVVTGTSLLFPFYGVQPFDWWAAAPVVAAALAVAWLVPDDWSAVRRGALVYAAGVVLVWLVPSPVGSNVERLSLLFAGSVLLAVLLNARRLTRRRALLVAVAYLSVACWLTGRTMGDLVVTVPVARAAADGKALINELHQVGADRARVEVVPLASHWEASGVAPYVDLARGWNRQADVTRNPLFYADKLAPQDYHTWLRRWGVGFVALSTDKPDDAAVEEAALVSAGQPWLAPVWQHGSWRLFRVTDATPLAEPPAVVQQAGPASLTVRVPNAGPVHLLLPWSPWLGIAGDQGDADGCLAEAGDWTVLYAPAPGTYRIAGKYSFDRGSPCRSGLAKGR
ncbi:MFS transporter [Kitasatospora sp. NBC_01287]|uniref:MFS transporter n=1 Tax=Kitasatospora sp. NBC_01287 TaxID=2903573 RepID=UPI002250C6C2|nr:MFS transporter [Kitasatospora sp. NBC_01287]MCX4745296.1 MFS transporter [Kitasatospora sp. NBC_01287]